jgi:prepilin-type N-terminal cleavage/methylation domain-containing protein
MSSAVNPMRNTHGPMRNTHGFSLIELFVVLILFGIMAAISALGYDYVQGHQLKAASQRLFGDLQKVRQDAMTQRTQPDPATGIPNSLGFGIRFSPDTGLNQADQYILFEFNDIDSDFTYDGVAEELLPVTTMTLPDSVTAKDTAGMLMDATDVHIYDALGMIRTANWSSVAGTTIVLDRSGIPEERCIVVSTVRIREGVWDGNDCL